MHSKLRLNEVKNKQKDVRSMLKYISASILALSLSSALIADDNGTGLVSIKSQHTVNQTADRFESILKKKGINVFARVDHEQNAEKVALKLAPTQVIIFGNPKIGTPLMQCSKTVAIDLPQKALFWQDDKGQAWVTYNAPAYLKERHAIKGCDQVITKISNVLANLTRAAAN